MRTRLARLTRGAAAALPALAYLGGLAAITAGAVLVAVPLGLVVGGAFSTASAIVWLVNQQRTRKAPRR